MPKPIYLSVTGPQDADADTADTTAPTATEHAREISPILDALLRDGIDAGIAVSERIRKQIMRSIRADMTPEEKLAIVRRVLIDAEPIMAANVSNTLLAAWLAGGENVAAPLPTTAGDDSPPLPPPGRVMLESGAGDDVPIEYPIIDEAARNLASRRVMTAADYYAAGARAKSEAFTVSQVASERTLESIRDFLVNDVTAGGTLREFREFMEAETPLSPARIELIYRQNGGVAFARGQEKIANLPLVQSEFPYVMNASIKDSRLTKLCAVINRSGIAGTNIFRKDDPVWQHFRPLRHFQCRCGAIYLSVEDAARHGIHEAMQWLQSGVPPMQPEFVPWPDVELPKGWVPGGGG